MFSPQGRMSFGSSYGPSYDGSRKDKQREHNDEEYSRKGERWIVEAEDVQSMLLEMDQKLEGDNWDEVQEKKVILVLGEPSPQDLQTLLRTPQIAPYSHLVHAQLKPGPDTLIILVTHKPPTLLPPPPNGTRPRSLIVLRLLPAPSPASAESQQQRLSSIFSRAEAIARSWRGAPESIFPTAVQPYTRCATQWSEMVPGGEFCVVEEIGYTGAITAVSSHQRLPSSNKPAKFSIPKFRLRPKRDLTEASRPAFDALINFVMDPEPLEFSDGANVDEGAILKDVILVSTLSLAFLTASRDGDVFSDQRGRSRGRSTHRENERGRSTKRSGSLESIKRFFSRSRSRSRTAPTSTSTTGETHMWSTSVSGNVNNIHDASSSTWSLSTFIRRGRQLSESGLKPRTEIGMNGELGMNAGESTSSLPLARRASPDHEGEAPIHSGLITPKKEKGKGKEQEDGPAYDTDETPSTSTPSMPTTKEAGMLEYERTGNGKTAFRKERRRSISVGAEGYNKDRDMQAAVQENRERGRENVKQKVLNSWSRHQLDLANSAGGAVEKMRGRVGGRERSEGRSPERRGTGEGESVITGGRQRRGRAHIIHVLPGTVLPEPQGRVNTYDHQDQTNLVSSSSRLMPVTVDDENLDLSNPHALEDNVDTPPAGLPSTFPNPTIITPPPSGPPSQVNLCRTTPLPLDLTRSISPPPRSQTLSPALSAALESAAPYSSVGRALSSARSPRQSTIFSVLGETDRELAKKRGRELSRRSSAYEAASAAAIAAMEIQMSKATSPLPRVSSDEGFLFPSWKNERRAGISSLPPQIPASLLPDPHRQSNWAGILNEAVAKAGMGLGSATGYASPGNGEGADTDGREEGEGGGVVKTSATLLMPLALLSGPHVNSSFRSSSLDSGIVIPGSSSALAASVLNETPLVATTSAPNSSIDQESSVDPATLASPSASHTSPVSAQPHSAAVTLAVDFPSSPDPPNAAPPSLCHPKTELVQRIERFLLSFSYPAPPPPPLGTVLPLPKGAAKPTVIGGPGGALINGRSATGGRDDKEKSVSVKQTPESPIAHLLPSSVLGETLEFVTRTLQITVTLADLILLGMLDPSPDLVAGYHEALAVVSVSSTNLHGFEDAKVPRVWIGDKQDISIIGGLDVIDIRRAASGLSLSLATPELPLSAVTLHAQAVAPAHCSRPRTSSGLRNASQEYGDDERSSYAPTAPRSAIGPSNSSSESPRIDSLNLGRDSQDGWRMYVKSTFGPSSSRSPSKEKGHDESTSDTNFEGGVKTASVSKAAIPQSGFLGPKSAMYIPPTGTVPADLSTVRPAYASTPPDAPPPTTLSHPSQIRSIPVGAAQPIAPTAFLLSGINWNLAHPNLYKGQTDYAGLSSRSNVCADTETSYHATNASSPPSARTLPANTSPELGKRVNDSTTSLEKVSCDSTSNSEISTIPMLKPTTDDSTDDSTLDGNYISESERSVSASKLVKAPSAQFLAELGLGPGDREKLLRSAATGGTLKTRAPVTDATILDLHAATIPSSPSDDCTTDGTATPVEGKRNSGLWLHPNCNLNPISRPSTVSSLPLSSPSSSVPPSPGGVAVTVHTASLTASPSACLRLSIDAQNEAGENQALASDSISLNLASVVEQEDHSETVTAIPSTISTISQDPSTTSTTSQDDSEATASEATSANVDHSHLPPPQPPPYSESESDSLSMLSLPLLSLNERTLSRDRNTSSPSSESECRSTIASSGLFSRSNSSANPSTAPAHAQGSVISTSTLRRPGTLSAFSSISVRGPRPIPSRPLSRTIGSDLGQGSHSRTGSVESMASARSIQSGKEALAAYAGIAGGKLGRDYSRISSKFGPTTLG